MAIMQEAQGGLSESRLKVLVVEDHVDTAKMLGKLLGSAGYRVRTATDASAALQLAATEPFDVIVSDIGLPDGTGYTLMEHLRQQYGVRGIAMSGYGMEEDIRKSHAAGFSDHLVKPITFSQLEKAIERVIKAPLGGECGSGGMQGNSPDMQSNSPGA